MAKFPTFEAYCKAKKIDPNQIIPDFAYYPEKHRQAMIDHAKLSTNQKRTLSFAGGYSQCLINHN